MRGLLSLGVSTVALTLFAASAAAAELPLRKAGLWEMKIVKTGSKLPDMTMQHCTEPTTDKEMSNSVAPLAKQPARSRTSEDRDRLCQRFRLHRQWRGDDVACGNRRRFRFRLHGHSTSHMRQGTDRRNARHRHHDEAKWVGACKPDQKPATS